MHVLALWFALSAIVVLAALTAASFDRSIGIVGILAVTIVAAALVSLPGFV